MSFPLGWQRKYRFIVITYFAVSSQSGRSLQTMSCKKLGWTDSSIVTKPCGSTGLHPYAYNIAIISSPHLLWNCKETTFFPVEHNWKCKCEEAQPPPHSILPFLKQEFLHCCSKWLCCAWRPGRVQVWAHGQEVIPGYEKLLLRVVDLGSRKYIWGDFKGFEYKMLQWDGKGSNLNIKFSDFLFLIDFSASVKGNSRNTVPV